MSRSIAYDNDEVTPPHRLPIGVRRVGYLDGARAAAALFVLIHHTYCMAYPIRNGIEPTGALGYVVGWMVYGHFGVTVFIVLAGYSLFIALAHRSGRFPGGVVDFVKRRAWRIIPPFWIALLITVALVLTFIGSPTGTHWDQSVPTSPKGWVIDALLLQDIVPVQDAAYTFWSISVEWHIYFLVPVILFIRTRSTWTTAIAVGVGLGLAGMVLTFVNEKFGRIHPEYYVVFAIAAGGCLIVAHAPSWARRVPWRSASALSISSVIVLCATHDFAWAISNFPWLDLLLGAGVVSLLIAIGLGRADRVASALGWVPLARLGAFSYSIYLVHAQLLQVFWQGVVDPLHLDRPAQLLFGWAVGVPLIVGASFVFSLVAERPFVRREARMKARRALTATGAP